MKQLKSIISVIFYYFLESFAIALIISLFWKVSLQYRFNLEVTLFDWTGIVLGIKLIRFDILKVLEITGIFNKETEKNDEIHKKHT